MSMQKLNTVCFQGAPFLLVCRCHAVVCPHGPHVDMYLVGPAAHVHLANSRLFRRAYTRTHRESISPRVELIAKHNASRNSNIRLVAPSQVLISYSLRKTD